MHILLQSQCCTADTLPASLSNVSRTRPTKDRHRRFVTAWPILLLRKRIGPSLAPAHFPTPLHALGPAATSTELTGPVLRAGPDCRNKTPVPRGHREGDRGGVRVSLPRRTARETITHGRFGIPWAEKWPLIEILLKCRDPDIKAKSSRAARLTKHQAATSSISVGSSSPPPVLLTRRDTGHMQRRPSPAGLRSSVPAAPFSHGPILSLSSTTGIRS